MRIKRIEIIGFKSFCDRTVLNFSDPVTAVVGPNGCGKSNIVDAIRWSMGEQSAKHLRGHAMGDVIFAGSDSRNPAGMAEVSLTFEDVGFSAETLELALGDDAILEDPALAGVEEEAGTETDSDSESDSDTAAVAADVDPDDPEAVAAAEAKAAAEAQKAQAMTEASRDVEDFLADKAPTVDLSRYSEVTITRRLFRDGTSGYFINKVQCRLRDVTDFFLGTGVGTKAYSIIEQGRIGMIVSARASERRHIIEEAAGITKFKTKKRAAERKLEQTRQNLLRVTDIVAELHKRLGTLRRQAQKAERFRRYRAEVKDIELWTASHKWLELAATGKQVEQARDALATEHTDKKNAYEALDAKLVSERTELAVEERRLAGLEKDIYELENQIKLGESKIEYQRREADELSERAASGEGEVKSLSERCHQAEAEVEKQREDLGTLSKELGEIAATASERDAAFAATRQLLARAQEMLDRARNEVSSARSDLARADSARESIGQRNTETGERLARVLGTTDELNAKVVELSRGLRKTESQLAELRQTRLGLADRAETFERRKKELTHDCRSREAEVETLRDELHRRRSRLQSLQEIHDKYEGFARGTRAVMQNADSVTRHGEAGRIRGVVADVIETPPDLETAVEAALGDRLGGILVSSQDLGARAVRFLKDEGGGRSSFVPVPSSRPAFAYEDRSELMESVTSSMIARDARPGFDSSPMSGAAPVQSAAAGGEGILGTMSDLVTTEPDFDAVAFNLLGDKLVVESLDRALELRRNGCKQTMITLEGDVVDSDGVVSGGSRDASGAGVLAQRREIRELGEMCESMAADLSNATARFVATKAELSQVTQALEALKAETHDGELAITACEKDAEGARSELDRLKREQAAINAEQLNLQERTARLESELAQACELRESAIERIERGERQQSELNEQVEEGRARAEEMVHAVTEAKVKVAKLGEKKASVEASTLRLEAANRQLSDRIEEIRLTIDQSGARAAELRRDADAIEEVMAEQRKRRRETAEALHAGRTAYEGRMSEMQVAERDVRALRTEVERLGSEATAAEMQLANQAMTRDHLEEGVHDRYGLELSKVLGDYHLRALPGEEQEARLSQLKRLIDRMGMDINLTAIEEFTEISERHDFLSGQRDDLDKAVTQLEKAIVKINRTSRRLFAETFEAINNEFMATFPKLFRGGRAKLQLTGDGEVDILEAGVEITAQPPGKKNTTVDQLSGGEKALTAVALLFAIFRIKPSPFCLLDEVDAPLDDANVDRYNEYLREMTDRSQFIVITHNKRTMEIADRLYGVTMQEPGCSKIVSVNLAKLGDKDDGQAA